MSRFKCEGCNKIFSSKQRLVYHTDRKVCKEKKHECRYCTSKFTTATAMYRHMREACKIKNNIDSNKRLEKLEKKNSKLEEENKELRERINNIEKRVTKQPKVINNTYVENNGTININNNLTLVGFGKEDLDKIDKDDLSLAFRKGFKSTLYLTKIVHFNPKYPEYSNVKRTNSNSSYARIHDGEKWNEIKIKDLVDKIYDDKRYYIEENYGDYENDMLKSQKDGIRRFLMTDDDSYKIDTVKSEIKSLLWNERQIAEDNEKRLKYQTECDLVDTSNSKTVTTINTHIRKNAIDKVDANSNNAKKPKTAIRNGKKRKAIARRRSQSNYD